MLPMKNEMSKTEYCAHVVKNVKIFVGVHMEAFFFCFLTDTFGALRVSKITKNEAEAWGNKIWIYGFDFSKRSYCFSIIQQGWNLEVLTLSVDPDIFWDLLIYSCCHHIPFDIL